jgi:hypothetical protein
MAGVAQAARKTVVAGAIWSATGALLLFNLVVAGFVHDRFYYGGLTDRELSEATGNGVVPGYWFFVPIVTVIVIVPLWLVLSGLGVGAVRLVTGRFRHVAATCFVALVVVSIAVHTYLVTTHFGR